MNDEPSLIIGRALAAWANPPRWFDRPAPCTREEAERSFTEFVETVCANWGLAIVHIGVLEEK